MASLQAVRGMNDILPSETPYWQRMESKLRSLATQYGYQEIRLPIVESTELFCRTIGAVTDIVEKEMYVFDDRNGDSLSLRPEGTAGCVRAGIEHGLLYNQQQKVWYQGPMFRHERPQKGRYRQFHHFGLEAFGLTSPLIDAELLALSYQLWQMLGLTEKIHLEINTLGTSAERALYRQNLVAYYQKHVDMLDEDSQRRLQTNPLRILDSKNPDMIALNKDAPLLIHHLNDASLQHYAGVKAHLTAMQIPFHENHRLVRGLDYYTHTVFEWVTDALGAQGTVAAGGRYDALVAQLGGKATPAVGMAFGLERVLALWQQTEPTINRDLPSFFVGIIDASVETLASAWVSSWRKILPASFWCEAESLNPSTVLKRADKRGADYALLFDNTTVAEQTVLLKPLRGQGEPQRLNQADVAHWLAALNTSSDRG